MFKLKTLLILTFLTGFLASAASADSFSRTQSFKLSVTIPASVSMASATMAPELKARAAQIVQEQKTVRNNTIVIVQSTVIL